MRGQDSKGLTAFAAAAAAAIAAAVAAVGGWTALAGELPPALRGDAPLAESAAAPPAAAVEDRGGRRTRNYPEQPPTIPHKIDGYEISLRANKCLTCHARRAAADAGAPMVGVTHFMNADLQMLSEVSARRYFCNQCHVVQTTARDLVGNGFVDAADLD